MPNISQAFPSKYIKAGDLGGRAVVVVIDHISFEEVGRDKDSKPVLYFRGKEKGLVLNKTNASKITAILGSSETDDWEGRAILIYPTEVEYAGETMEGIRVKAAPSNGKRSMEPPPSPPLPPESDDDTVPF